jgi:pimeloyl-ACP methyl ester carboxylesterase
MRVVRAAAALLLLLGCVTGCAQRRESIRRLTLDGQAVQVWRGTSRSAVVFLHGYRGDERLVQGRHGDLATSLHEAGWTVAASTAHGNAWGDAASVADYERLIDHLRDHYGVDRVALLGVSMGALAGLRLVERGRSDTFVGVSAVTDMAAVTHGLLRRSITETYGTVPRAKWDEAALRRARVTFVADPADDVIPTATHSRALARRLGAPYVPCTGKHTGRDCYAKALAAFGPP